MKEKIVLKSARPDEYPDLEVECRVIPEGGITEYLESLESTTVVQAFKTGVVQARVGEEGEKVVTTLKTVVDGRTYILSEEDNVVKRREMKTPDGETVLANDVVVTNVSSTSNEQYVVRAEKFRDTYTPVEGVEGAYEPVPEVRTLTQVPENVIFLTSWGAPAVCLAGSYIVAYNAAKDDYNTIEAGAFESTYQVVSSKQKVKKI